MMLSVKDIHFRHTTTQDDVLKGISFEAHKANITTILGPNGSGKTSLLKCIAGLWRYHRGEICFDGRGIGNMTNNERARLLSLVTQGSGTTFGYSVFDMVLMGRSCYIGVFSCPTKIDHQIAEGALQAVGIEHLKNRQYTKVSEGERQLTLIARALAQQTPVILLDEPTSHLDLKNQVNVLSTIKKIAIKKQLVIVMTLHETNLAGFFSDRLVVIKKGRKVAEGSPQEIISEELFKKVYEVQVKTIKIDGKTIVYPDPMRYQHDHD